MVITQWYEILGVIAVIFVGVLALLVLVVYLEAWLAQPDRHTMASIDEQTLDEPGRNRIGHRTPDLSVHPGAPYLPPARAPGLGLDPPAARAAGHLFTVLSPSNGQQ